MDFQGLQQFPLLQDFTNAELRDLLATAREQELAAGAFICREGEPGGALYFVVRGQVEVSKKDKEGTPRVITLLGDGTLLGELSWITGASYTATVQAKQDTAVIRLDGRALTLQVQQNSTGAYKFTTALLKLLAGRLLRTNEQVLDSQSQLDTQKKGEIERLRERILRDWSF
ncbi:MAG: cyclic nucleotide-binding domain-containing protein [Deltaproteobacteria bacterium]|nr:cyclic nucleotide-binding domain-containing protein [Deltaproteobacteria bacterium]